LYTYLSLLKIKIIIKVFIHVTFFTFDKILKKEYTRTYFQSNNYNNFNLRRFDEQSSQIPKISRFYIILTLKSLNWTI